VILETLRLTKEFDALVHGGSLPKVLVYFSKIHAVSVLEPGDLARVELHFQVSRENRNVDGLTLRGAGAFGAKAVKFHIPVVGLHKLVDDRIHNFSIVRVQDAIANRAKTLEPHLVSSSSVTLLE